MNYFQTLEFGSHILKINKIKSHNLDSELLLSFVLNSSREKILINLSEKIKKENFKKFKKLISRRINKEPIAYITGGKEFWKSYFFVNKDVLIPRPETELIIEEMLKIIDKKSFKRLLEVGTGSGCIIISIMKERPNCRATAIDISKKAINIAKSNAKMHHLVNKIKFVNIDIDNIHLNKYDFVISNPPYISKIDLSRLDQSVKFYEPYIALEAGTDGLREIKRLILKSKELLKTNGKLIFEIGAGQSVYTKQMLKDNGYYINKVIKDFSSIPRVIISTKIN